MTRIWPTGRPFPVLQVLSACQRGASDQHRSLQELILLGHLLGPHLPPDQYSRDVYSVKLVAVVQPSLQVTAALLVPLSLSASDKRVGQARSESSEDTRALHCRPGGGTPG